MAQQQSSRLHRLLTLLDTGSTLATRKTAAKQIGEIAKSRPEELHALLKKVSPFLHSKSWDTRVAAATAVGAIAENVNLPSLKDLLSSAQKSLSELGYNLDLSKALAASWISQCSSSRALSFCNFDIVKVMEFGAPLLSSGGQEYDVSMDDKSPADRLARQKQNLRRRLGLDVCEQFMDVNEMIRDDDLIQKGENGQWSHFEINYRMQGKQQVQQLVANMVPGNIPRCLSARERNLLKRKAKGSVKDSSKGWCEDDDADEPTSKKAKNLKSVVVDQTQSGEKILMEAVPQEDVSEPADGEWPFGHFLEQLMHDMFDSVWEVRHGSIMALREILSVQAASAAVIMVPLEADDMSETDGGEEIPTSSKKEREIDLNVGLGIDDTSNSKKVKLEKSSSHSSYQQDSERDSQDVKTLKMEDFLSKSTSTAIVKPYLDLNGDIKHGPFQGKVKGVDNLDIVLASFPQAGKAAKMFKTIQQAWLSNTEFLQDCTIRFLCIFSLDRFGDYVSDQVVAPVRETCAQALGAVLKQMHPVLVHETLGLLLLMQKRPEWEIRHGSLLGIKYLVAVRQEMLSELLPRVLPACIAGLEDTDDDVRAVAAEAMTPAAAAIVSSCEEHTINTILLMLWDILLDLDDLSPSTSSVMHLLAEIYFQQEMLCKTCEEKVVQRPYFDLNESVLTEDDPDDVVRHMDDPFVLSTLAPRLWPFMRHNISSVRHAAVSTLERLLETGKKSVSELSWVIPILGDALRLIYQNFLLETDCSIVECSRRVWRLLLESPKNELALAAARFFQSWLKLASTAAGSPLEATKMFSPMSLPVKSHVRAAAKMRAVRGEGSSAFYRKKEDALKEKNMDSSFQASAPKVIVGADTEKSVVQMRVSTASALGVLAAFLPESMYLMIVENIRTLISSTSGVQRQVASMVLVSWFKELRISSSGTIMANALEASKVLLPLLLKMLACGDPALPNPDCQLPYSELLRTYGKMRSEAASVIKLLESPEKVFPEGVPVLDLISAEGAIDVAMKIGAMDSSCLHGHAEDEARSGLKLIEPLRQRLLATAGYLKLVQGNLHVSVLASMAGAIAWMGELPMKLNPIIHPLMAAIKHEQEDILQLWAADALAETIEQCVGRKPSPNEKLIKNLCVLACADPAETPQATQDNAEAINLDDIEVGSGPKLTSSRQKSQASPTGEERLRMEAAVSRRGAELALKSLCKKFGSSVFEKLPKLWDCLTEALNFQSSGVGGEAGSSDICEQNGDPQAIINNLQVIRAITPVLDKCLQSRFMTLLPAIFVCVRFLHAAVRLAAARCLTDMAKAWPEPIMVAISEKGVPMLYDSAHTEARQGASLLLMFLVESLGTNLVPYAPLLIIPLLGCMSDSDSVVRQAVTHSFATLVPLLPLAKGIALPSGLNGSFLSSDAEDTRFLEQLLDNRCVDDYQLSVELKTTLRRYQQEGINWLAFLKRFKLHGILCDDMGLGKTLQTLAFMASDMAERLKTHGYSMENLQPSLIVCPSTLIGHWVYEIEKFLQTPILSPLQYVGTLQDRLQLQPQLTKCNLIVTSYDVLRKDVEFFGNILWNFCILDEGHIIKSAKSKVTLAIKQIKAEHRVILSGTPIQNNVLELWSLFDFLMPGFLGTERQFQSRYGKAILAARDPKCSAKEAEAGALAMEALHKQVMPFLLRRTKDEVLSDLPPKIIQDRFCDLSPLQVRLYERFSQSRAKVDIANIVEGYGSASDAEVSKAKSSPHVFQALQYLRKLCSHPLLVMDESDSDQVAVAHPDGEESKMNLHELHHSPKLLALKEILEECGIGSPSAGSDSPSFSEGGGHHRVLVFGQLKSFLDIIEKDLFQKHMQGITYLRLDGSIEPDKRFDIVKTFNSDPTIDVLLLTTHVGGLGLNLTAADTVVFMEHDWNPMRDLQAMDRAHRLGQKRVVNVHRLIMRGTLEEKVMSLQRFKLSVANAVINAENASLNTMDTTQLLDLFAMPGSAKNEKPKQAENETEVGVHGARRGLKAILSGLEELWDQSQYEEYNLGDFVARLNG